MFKMDLLGPCRSSKAAGDIAVPLFIGFFRKSQVAGIGIARQWSAMARLIMSAPGQAAAYARFGTNRAVEKAPTILIG